MADEIIQNQRAANEGEKIPAPTGNKPKKNKPPRPKLNLAVVFGAFKPKSGPSSVAPQAIPVVKKTGLLPGKFNAQKVNLKSVNQGLSLVLAGLVGMMVYVIFRPGPEIAEVVASVSKLKLPAVEPKKITPFEGIAYYLDEMKSRDIFSAHVEVKEPEIVQETAAPPPPPPKVMIAEKAKNLKLIGISWGNDPKAIIREISSDSMYFVGEGEIIKGTEITVKSISKEEVIISSDGDEMTML